MGATSHSALVERLRSFTQIKRAVLPCSTSNSGRGRGLFPPGPTCSRAGTLSERRRWTVTLRRMSRGKVVANVPPVLCGLLFCSGCIQVERKPLPASVITEHQTYPIEGRLCVSPAFFAYADSPHPLSWFSYPTSSWASIQKKKKSIGQSHYADKKPFLNLCFKLATARRTSLVGDCEYKANSFFDTLSLLGVARGHVNSRRCEAGSHWLHHL